MSRPTSPFRDQAPEARLARMWDALDARFDRAQQRRRAWRIGGALALPCAVALLLFFLWPRVEDTSIQLADGSRVEHPEGEPLRIDSVSPRRVEVSMGEGRATFRIVPNPAREFLTHAGGYTVRVLGTEYTVELRADGLRVAVARGAVEVRRDGTGDVWQVRTGESWSSTRGPVADAAIAAPMQPSESAPSLTHDASAEAPRPLVVRPPSDRRRPTREEGKHTLDEPAALFQRAQDARLAGRSEEAARLLGELIERHADDPRVGVSAYELARLRLDLGDPRAALRALERARSAGYAQPEQIEMRRVQALEEAGDVSACRAARDAFLARYPGGSFSAMVRRRCP
jgi:hypothetical protein